MADYYVDEYGNITKKKKRGVEDGSKGVGAKVQSVAGALASTQAKAAQSVNTTVQRLGGTVAKNSPTATQTTTQTTTGKTGTKTAPSAKTQPPAAQVSGQSGGYNGLETARQRQEWYNAAKQQLKTLTGAEKDALKQQIERYERGEGEWAAYNEAGYQTAFSDAVVDKYLMLLENQDFVDSGEKTEAVTYVPSGEDLRYYDEIRSAGYETKRNYYDQEIAFSNVDGAAMVTDKDGNFVHPATRDPRFRDIDRLGVWLRTSEAERAAAGGTLDQICSEAAVKNWQYLTEEEITVYYALRGRSVEEAEAFLADMQSTLNHRYQNDETLRTVQEYEDADWLGRAAMNVQTIPENMLSGVTGFVTMSLDRARGKETDFYGRGFEGMHYSNTVRGETARNWDEAMPEVDFLGLSAGDLYMAGMSGADSLVASWMGPGGSALLATSAAVNKGYELSQQGASSAQIYGGALAAGAIEMAAEHIPLEKLNFLKTKDVATWVDFGLNILKQSGCEFGEEAATEIANGLADAVNMRSQSDWAKLWEANDGDAFKVAKVILGQACEAGLSGAFSGGSNAAVVSLPSAAKSTAQTRRNGAAVKDGGAVADLKAYAAELAQQSKDAELAKYAARVNESSSDASVGKLQHMTQTAARAYNRAQISQSLQESGYSKSDANKIAEVVEAKAAGQELTGKQKQLWAFASQEADVRALLNQARQSAGGVSAQSASANVQAGQSDAAGPAVSRTASAAQNTGTATNQTAVSEADIRQSLERNGVKKPDIPKLAPVIRALAEGKQLTTNQQQMLDFARQDPGIQAALNETLQKSGVNQVSAHAGAIAARGAAGNTVSAQTGQQTGAAVSAENQTANGTAKPTVSEADIRKSLENNGVKKPDIPKLTPVIRALAEGKQLTTNQQQMLDFARQDPGIQAALDETLQKSGGEQLTESVQKQNGAIPTAQAREEGALSGVQATQAESRNDLGNKPVNIKLTYKPEWTAEQRAQADKKLKALSEAYTVKTEVTRKKKSASKRFKEAYGEEAVPDGYDVDHVIDLQLGGSDDIINMEALDKSVNRSLGAQIMHALKDYPVGTVIGKFTISERRP